MARSLRDPIHGSIDLDPWVTPIIDAPVFQRLRRVSQLGMAHLVYPGAHHRRFEHSLGAYHLAGRIAAALELDPADARTVRAAALVHDVGHGPFSHSFEEILKEEGRRHEETTVDLVRWGPLADLLRQGNIDPVEVADAVMSQGPLANVVSGAIDADRMDYLLRDAHYTGVRTSADPDRLCRVLRRDPQHGVILAESGVLAAESLLTTRFMMYPAVYLHHTVRACEAMLLAAVRAYLATGKENVAQLERLTDDALLTRLRGAKGVPADLVARLDDRRLFKRAVALRAPEAEAAGLLHKGKVAKKGDEIRALAADIADAAGVAAHHVQLDVPAPPKFREMDVQVQRLDGELSPLAKESRLVQVLHEARMDHWRAWVFCPQKDVAKVEAATGQILA